MSQRVLVKKNLLAATGSADELKHNDREFVEVPKPGDMQLFSYEAL
jgi:hypothetical protein